MGWAGAFGGLALAPVALYFAAFSWTIGYDTIYAMQDSRDDAIVGIRSTARLFEGRAPLGVGMFYAAAAALSLAAIVLLGGGWIALAGWLGYAAHLGWQVSQVDGAGPAKALSLFRSNRDAGFILFAGLAAQGWAG